MADADLLKRVHVVMTMGWRSTEAPSVGLLAAWCDHYVNKLKLTNIHVGIFYDENGREEMDSVVASLSQRYPLVSFHLERLDKLDYKVQHSFRKDMLNLIPGQMKYEDPDNFILSVDVDEFVDIPMFPTLLSRLAAQDLDGHGVLAVPAVLMDRLADNPANTEGHVRLPVLHNSVDLSSDGLSAKFPYGINLTGHVLGATCTKLLLFRSRGFFPDFGSHAFSRDVRVKLYKGACLMINHYKWHAGLHVQVGQRLKEMDGGPVATDSWEHEYFRLAGIMFRQSHAFSNDPKDTVIYLQLDQMAYGIKL